MFPGNYILLYVLVGHQGNESICFGFQLQQRLPRNLQVHCNHFWHIGSSVYIPAIACNNINYICTAELRRCHYFNGFVDFHGNHFIAN